ncbi:hypothetical protein DEO72_LG5g322 [Vigna unguiculata]|uniref:Uncharacterized protein n=1 Tax=Vigna unguiculata TaxID=3917 RepID=A0A4D6LUZ5_VIGUN|nr:hypothetical protein DEO72_LG5g322 [Vigna unguiculata]
MVVSIYSTVARESHVMFLQRRDSWWLPEVRGRSGSQDRATVYGSERVAAAWFRIDVARGGLTSRWLPVWLHYGGVAQRRKNQFAILVRAEKMNSAGFANLES